MIPVATRRRKLGNPLALAVMVLLTERPMHPYEIAQTLRSRGKDTSLKINYGSLYTVVQSLEKHGFVEVAEVQRQGNRPERTLYGITDAGREEATEWLSDLLAVPTREFPIFEAALSLMGVIHPDEVARLLADRLKKFVRYGVLRRVRYQESPARYEYILTQRGLDLYPVIMSIVHWGDTHMVDERGRPLLHQHKNCGKTFDPVMVCSECGEPLHAKEVHVHTGPGAATPAAAPDVRSSPKST